MIHVWWNIRNFINHSRSNLRNMHINHQTIVAINFHQLVLAQIFRVDVVLNISVLVRENHIWMAIFVSRRRNVVALNIFPNFVFVEIEVKIAISRHLIKSVAFKGKAVSFAHMLSETSQFNLLLNQSINLALHLCNFAVVGSIWLCKVFEVGLAFCSVIQHRVIVLVRFLDFFVALLDSFAELTLRYKMLVVYVTLLNRSLLNFPRSCNISYLT